MANMSDAEMQLLAKVWASCIDKYYMKMRIGKNTMANIKAIGEMIQEEFYDAGFIVNVDMSNCDQVVIGTQVTPPPIVEVLRRVEGVTDFDYEKKAFEVRRSKDLGVMYDGDQGGLVNKARTKDAHRKNKG